MTNTKKKALIAKVHIAKKQLALDDGTYQDVLMRVTGKDSCKDMTIAELEKVVGVMVAHGFKPVATQKTADKHGKKPNLATNKQAILNKIEAILSDKGLHWNYAHAIAKRSFGRENLRFCSIGELQKVMQMLAVYQHRQTKKRKNSTQD